MAMMKAAVFERAGSIVLQDKPVPRVGPSDALMRVTTTTICGTDIHILKGEYPVAAGRIIGHEPVGIIEALGTQQTFESCLRVLKPGGVLSSLGVYSGKVTLPLDAFAAGLGDHKVISTLCPGGKERMRRLMSVIDAKRMDLGGLVTHRFKLDDIEKAYDLFANQRDGVLKVAITP